MADIDPTLTLAALVNQQPVLIAPLDQLRLDYCCGGDRSLQAAVASAGLDLAETLQSLEAVATDNRAEGLDASQETDWASMGPAELVDHLETTHHVYLKGALPHLTGLSDKVTSAHGERHPELHQIRHAVAELRADLEPHLMKEERVLFPMIRELAAAAEQPTFHCGSVANPIGMMRFEHDQAGELLARLRSLSSDYTLPDDACASYQALYDALAELEADTHLHVHKENNLLFPAAIEAEHALAT